MSLYNLLETGRPLRPVHIVFTFDEDDASQELSLFSSISALSVHFGLDFLLAFSFYVQFFKTSLFLFFFSLF